MRCQCGPALLQLCLGEHKRAGSELGKPNFLCWGQVNGILESLYCSCFGLSEQHSTITGPRITRSTKLWFVQNCSFSLAKEGASKEIPWLCLRKVDCYSFWGVWEWAVNDAKIQKIKNTKEIEQLQREKGGKNWGGGVGDNEMSVTISEMIPGRMDGCKKVPAGNEGTHHSPLPKLLLQCPKTCSHSEYDTICASQMQFALFFLLFMYLFLVSCLL